MYYTVRYIRENSNVLMCEIAYYFNFYTILAGGGRREFENLMPSIRNRSEYAK